MSDTFSPDDVKFMQLALELAAKGSTPLRRIHP